MPQWSSAWEISVAEYVPRGVRGTPIRFASADAIVRSWSRSSVPRRSSSAPSFAETVSDVVALEDAGGAFEDLHHRPVGDALAVGEAAAPQHVGVVRRPLGDLGHEPALADARVADDRRERRDGPSSCTFSQSASRRSSSAVRPTSGASCALPRAVTSLQPECLPDGHRLRLALGGDRLVLGVLDRMLARAVGVLADEDPVDGSGRLDAGGGVEDVAPGDPLPLLGAVAVGDDHLAGRDADPHLDLADRVLAVERGDRVEDQEAGAHRALGIVLVRDGDAEMRDDRVADVLLDGAAAALELGAQAAVVELEQAEDVLRVERLGERGRPDEVDEDERVELALLVGNDRRRSRGGTGERRAAFEAETRAFGVLLAAIRTGDHVHRV